MAGRHRSAGRGAAEADAPRPGLDDDEYLRERFDGRQAGGEQQGGPDGPEERITMKGPCKHTKTHPGVFAASVWVGYLGLAFLLSGCGGLQRPELAIAPLCFEYNASRRVIT